MLYYPNKNNVVLLSRHDERQFFIPFLLGGLAGGAAVSLSRPRPIYNVAPQPSFNPMMPSGNYSYSYYVPSQMPY